ncbi:MAG: DUF6065 family protein [Serpentinimonas sp.]|jgi:hypothetical protein|nr:DUF6065 family protein [Serpentinimonas sp.]
MFALRTPPQIEFLCDPADLGVIAAPIPAREVLPDWFRRLPAVDKQHLSTSDNALTVKRCMPFLDAMTTGWVIPLAATVRLEIADGGQTVHSGWDFDRTMISNHHAYQVAGHPAQPRPPCKFHNHWTIRTPKGWSCLFLQPLNRPNGVFEIAAGVVDTDSYTSLIHFPFFATGPDGLHTLEKGMPLAQVIPFQRSSVQLPGVVRAETPAEAESRVRIQRATAASDGWYRKEARDKR